MSINSPGTNKPSQETLQSELFKANIPDSHPSPIPDDKTQKEQNDYSTEFLREKLKALRNETKQKKKEHKQRVKYAKTLFWLISLWLTAVLIIVICSGIDWHLLSHFKLSDNVLITLLTTTTVTVLGLFITVLKYLFNHKK